ncbi:MAG: ATP-dependent helicase [Planctomycetia bacterium 21-64-5]|nr:MAG: ATP-dependent helicase [Planctomycetia bacterium 21-64-5]HQU42804.1 DEAD/DEAH box helicase [Pirellulales bacterium]
MSDFDELHPALQHHIVNSLGWRELRPFQEAVIAPILASQHLIVLAPTAGGKTEAAFFPVISRMLSEDWSGLSLLYICPIKALLNNLDVRLQRYCSLLGRRSALWHGDVTTTARRHVLRDPPDCLLTTPESLEVMLVSPNVDDRRLFSQVRAVIVDEIHAFAGDDRGWHLLSVLERITKLAGREIQRIGLSATVGNPDALIEWLAGSCRGERRVFVPPATATSEADVKLDYVGSLRNAAVVISRLHRGEKRLVFIDSRARAEELGMDLRQLGVTAFVTHSSLSQEQRHQAEDAFANREDCVIVATSVLELGIDVGNLDHVIQIDSPATVSSFLQRMGRTGRRPGTTRNCLFLATRDETLVQAAGLIDLWSEDYIEPIEPPVEPYHVVAQQLMALSLQERGIGRSTWLEWIRGVPAFGEMPGERIEQVVGWMLERDLLWEDEGILGIGKQGEEAYGRKHFLELFSVFMSPPLFSVLHGRQELGFVDELTFLGKQEGPRILLLGGRSWRVTHVDWQRKTAYVEAAEEPGKSRWAGTGPGLGFRLCQAIKQVLASDGMNGRWSQRAQQRLAEIRHDFAWLKGDASAVVLNPQGQVEWWTFAGHRANATLVPALSQATHSSLTHDSFTLRFAQGVSLTDVEQAILELRSRDIAELMPVVDERAVEWLKFADCLPAELALHILQARMQDPRGVERIVAELIRCMSA